MEDLKKRAVPWRPRRLHPDELAQRNRIANCFPGGAMGISLRSFSANPKVGRHRLVFEGIFRKPVLASGSQVFIAITSGASPRTPRAVLGVPLEFAHRLMDTVLGRELQNPKDKLSSGEEGALIYILDRIAGDWLAAGGRRFVMRGLLADRDQISDYLKNEPEWEARARIIGDDFEEGLSLWFSETEGFPPQLPPENAIRRAASWQIVLGISLGWSRLDAKQISNLEKGDLMYLDKGCRPGEKDEGYATLCSGKWMRNCRWLDRRRMEVVDEDNEEVQMDTKAKGVKEVAVELDQPVVRDAGAMEVIVRVEVGEVRMTVEQAAGLVPGRVIRLDREVGSSVNIKVGDKLIGRGELVEHEGLLAVEVLEVS